MTDNDPAKRHEAIAVVDAAMADQNSTIDEAWKAQHIGLVDRGLISLTQLEMLAKGQLEFIERKVRNETGHDTVARRYRPAA